MTDYELADFMLASLPDDERAETVASLRRAGRAELRRMQESDVVLPVQEGVEPDPA